MPWHSHAVTHLVSVCADWNAKGAGQSKVGQLDEAIMVDEQVLGLKIAVKDAASVAEVNALEELEHVGLDETRG